MIPRRLHAYWTGKHMPRELASFLKGWQLLHRNWEFTLWRDETLPPFKLQKYIDNVDVYSPKSFEPQHKANLIRYELLLKYGGFWIDCDLESVRSIDNLREHKFVAAWEQRPHFINNAFMGCEPGNKVMKQIVDGIPERMERKRNLRSNKQSGVGYITPIIKKHKDVTILDKEAIYPYGWRDVGNVKVKVSRKGYAVHHWGNVRRMKGLGWPA